MPVKFTLRSVPDKLHASWKIMASFKNTSMRLYLVRALKQQVLADIEYYHTKGCFSVDTEENALVTAKAKELLRDMIPDKSEEVDL